MSINEYKTSIKSLVDATDNEDLLKLWKAQLEKDSKNLEEGELTNDEWLLVEEGLADYENGRVLTLKEFTDKR